MIAEPMSLAMRAAAKKLAEEGRESEPRFRKTFYFPSDKEVRLIHIDTHHRPNGQERDEAVAPYYFGPDIEDGCPYPSAIAIIYADEEGDLPLPAGWGQWADAEVI